MIKAFECDKDIGFKLLKAVKQQFDESASCADDLMAPVVRLHADLYFVLFT